MGISDKIEAFITELMRGNSDSAEFGRNELADIFGCVPSQINYVISTRFSPERGYIVESRRGGGGYIKIRRIELGDTGDVIAGIGSLCDYERAKVILKYLFDTDRITAQTANLLLVAVSDKALSGAENKAKVRADIIKNVLLNI